MRISLSPAHSFWGLMNPKDLKLTLSLTEFAPITDIDESKLFPWELKQIVASVKSKKISISVQLEDLIKSVSELTETKETLVKKKVTSPKLKT